MLCDLGTETCPFLNLLVLLQTFSSQSVIRFQFISLIYEIKKRLEMIRNNKQTTNKIKKKDNGRQNNPQP